MQEPEVKLCEELFVHNDKTERARRLLPQDDLLIDLAELYKVFGDNSGQRCTGHVEIDEEETENSEEIPEGISDTDGSEEQSETE